jgi:transcriptional regulator with XRE-family HTH domain
MSTINRHTCQPRIDRNFVDNFSKVGTLRVDIEMEIPKSFGDWLLAARTTAGLTQQALADCAGLKDKSYIGLLENETPHAKSGQPRVPSIEVIKKLASCVNGDELLALQLAARIGEADQPSRSGPLMMARAGGESSGTRRGIEIKPKPPMTRERFVAALNSMGLQNFNPVKGWSKLTPEDMEEILRSIKRQLEATARAAAEALIEQKLRDKGR